MTLSKSYEFSSERLFFRGIAADDAEDIVRWRSNPDNYRFFFNACPITMEEHLAWFEDYIDDDSRFDFIVLDADGNSVGTVGLSHIDNRNHTCEISYMIGDESARGKGYAAEAVRSLTRVAFNELPVDTMVARILPGNVASMRVAESAGYVNVERVYRIDRKGCVSFN